MKRIRQFTAFLLVIIVTFMMAACAKTETIKELKGIVEGKRKLQV